MRRDNREKLQSLQAHQANTPPRFVFQFAAEQVVARSRCSEGFLRGVADVSSSSSPLPPPHCT